MQSLPDKLLLAVSLSFPGGGGGGGRFEWRFLMEEDGMRGFLNEHPSSSQVPTLLCISNPKTKIGERGPLLLLVKHGADRFRNSNA